jgi:alkanesulfonate monooxygenase SsuD/methylene tetrahydromethanopterin reductase-like flavin-dependent oxidoreductase (luciferase family)
VGRTEKEFRARAERIAADPEQLRRSNLGGTVAEVTDRVGRLRDLGASRVYFQLMDPTDEEHLELLATEVVPAFR